MTQRDQNKRSVDGDLGISRRDLLRRGAVVGGTVLWVTPVIQSMTRPAFAQTTPTGGCFNIKWEPATGCTDTGTRFCLTTPGDAGGCGPVASGFTSNTNWTATLPDGCTFVAGSSKCGSSGCEPASAVVNPDGTTTVTFIPCQGTGPQGQNQNISHIELEYCCE